MQDSGFISTTMEQINLILISFVIICKRNYLKKVFKKNF